MDEECNSRIDIIKKLTQVQCSDGNWNYDSYMFGLANGMIFCLAVLEDKSPEYMVAPEQWLSDIPDPTEKSTRTGG